MTGEHTWAETRVTMDKMHNWMVTSEQEAVAALRSHSALQRHAVLQEAFAYQLKGRELRINVFDELFTFIDDLLSILHEIDPGSARVQPKLSLIYSRGDFPARK
jgi:hypothetical protein